MSIRGRSLNLPTTNMPRTSFPTYSNPSTNSGRLSHHKVSLRLGSDVLNQWLKTPGSFQTYLLFTMQTEQAQSQSRCANFYFFKRIFRLPISPPYRPEAVGHVWPARLERSGFSRDSVKTNQPNRFAIGGAYRDRTDDPLLAKQVLSQLS